MKTTHRGALAALGAALLASAAVTEPHTPCQSVEMRLVDSDVPLGRLLRAAERALGERIDDPGLLVDFFHRAHLLGPDVELVVAYEADRLPELLVVRRDPMAAAVVQDSEGLTLEIAPEELALLEHRPGRIALLVDGEVVSTHSLALG